MGFFRSMSAIRLASLFLLVILTRQESTAQRKISCPDGDHFEIDLKQIQIQFDASSFAGTLSSLSILGARLEVAPKKLQEAAAATQQWDEFLKGLAAGYNTCAVTRQQYADGLNRIYPRLKEDAADLEEIRKILSEGRTADEKRLQNLLESYYGNLRQFAQSAGKEIILDRIEAVSEQVAAVQSGQERMLQGQQQQTTVLEAIQAKLNELNAKSMQPSVPTPAEVGHQISALRKSLLAKADEAETAYNNGYEHWRRYEFGAAAESFRAALSAVKLPEFYLGLGIAYREVPDLVQAENALRDGLTQISNRGNTDMAADLNAALGTVLFEKGDLDAAIEYTRKAISIDAKTAGEDSAVTVRDMGNLGQFLRKKGDFRGALRCTRRALEIAEKVFGSNDRRLATAVNNYGEVLGDREDPGDAEEALHYAQRALSIAENNNGPDSTEAALYTSNIGTLLQNRALKEKRDFTTALNYSRRALQIVEKNYGPDHPRTALFAFNVGIILENAGNPQDALTYFERALAIDRRAYGQDHPAVARDLFASAASMFSLSRVSKGDLETALVRAQQAADIFEKSYGSSNPDFSEVLNLLGNIFAMKRDLPSAVAYKQRALQMDEKIRGPENIEVAHDAFDVGLYLSDQGKLEESLVYFQRALKIEQKVYGPEDKFSQRTEGIVNKIEQQLRSQSAVQPK